MHIIFGHVGRWHIPLMRILQFFKFKVFYLFIESKSEFQENKIVTELKKKNIIPLPIEFEKNIPTKTFSLFGIDSDEISYKKNVKMIPDKILKRYCNLFSIDEKKVKKLRLLIQDVVGNQMTLLSARIGMWSAVHPSEKIIFINFKLINFFMPNVNHNIIKIIIPINIFSYFIEFIKKNFLSFLIFMNKNNKKQKNQILNKQNLDELSKKTVAFIPHKGLIYGSEENKVFEKSLYYSDDINSCLNKYNILHLDYSNYPNPEKNICWVSLNKIKLSSIQIFLKNLIAGIKTFYLIRSWSTFLGWILCIHQYNMYIKYCEIIKKFKNLKIAIIDYDHLCPKTLILALEKNNIKTVAAQERFITTFYKSYCSVLLDTYYASSEYTAKIIKNSKYHDIKNVIPMGQYRSDYISLYKNKTFPEEISKAKENGKKILIALGNHSTSRVESYSNPLCNWSAQIDFLEDCIRLAQNLNNTYIILRYKVLNWSKDKYFENILNKINNCENIIMSSNQKESFYGYQLCANADLIIAKHTSIADECLSRGIPVLFHEYTHNMQKIVLDIPNYLPPELICYNFTELLEKSKSLLFNSSSKLKDKISELNQTIYHVSEKGNIKNKIIGQLEKLISLT